MILALEKQQNLSQTVSRVDIKSHKEQMRTELTSMMKLLADTTQHNETIKAVEETQSQLMGIRTELLKIQTGNQDMKEMFGNQTVRQNMTRAAIEGFENQLVQIRDEFVQFQVHQKTLEGRITNSSEIKSIEFQISLLQDMLMLDRNSTVLHFELIGNQLFEIQDQSIQALINQSKLNRTIVDALAKIFLIAERLQYQIQAREHLQSLSETFNGKLTGIEERVDRILDEVGRAEGVWLDANRSSFQEISLIVGQLVSIQNQMALQGQPDNESNALIKESIEVKFANILDQLIQTGENLLNLNKTSGDRMLIFEDQLNQMQDQLIQARANGQKLNETTSKNVLMLTNLLVEAHIDRRNMSITLFDKMIGADLRLETVQQQLIRTLDKNVNKLQYDLDLIHLNQSKLSQTLDERILLEDVMLDHIQQELAEAKMDRRQINTTNLDQMKATQTQLAQAQIEIKNLSETFTDMILTDIRSAQAGASIPLRTRTQASPPVSKFFMPQFRHSLKTS